MSITPGTRIGPYEVIGAVGAGGMGEVYRARDARLDRDVAIKILPDAFAKDVERLARFEREAKTLAALNHPNIAQIYGLESSALVMELVAGEDLSDRIARGPIPAAEALAIARQIADALEAAHERGIIHRDLKPANVKVGEDGRVKVLDFGLAKAFDPAATSSAELMNSPTITSPATQLGMIIGTAAYMSPEQAKGRAVDRRADVWAFGVVLFEMLTGRRVFEGDDVTDVLASVLKDSPAHESLPAGTPRAVRRLLRRCLEKDRAKRLDSMAAAKLDIDEALGAPDALDRPESSPGMPLARAAAIVIATSLATALIGGAAVWRVMRPEAPRVMRFAITPPEGQVLRAETNHHDVVISRDGRSIAYWTQETSALNRIFVRDLGSFDTRDLDAGPEARGMSFSPNGDWIVFQSGGRVGAGSYLSKMPVAGGSPTVITEMEGLLRRASWGDDDWILYATGGTAAGLFRVRASGGAPEMLTVPDRAQGELDHIWPEWLPGGTHALFVIRRLGAWDIGLFELESRQWRALVRNGTMPSYVKTGHVLYVSNGQLYAVAFDLKRMETAGEPLRLGESVLTKETSGAADFAVSEHGTLAYLPGSTVSQRSTLFWLDRDGKREDLPAEPREYRSIAVAPDGTKAAVTIEEEAGSALWILDLARFTLARVTPAGMTVNSPVWAPDSRYVAFASGTVGNPGALYRVAVSGTNPPEEITPAEGTDEPSPSGWTPDGTAIVFSHVFDGSRGLATVDVKTRRVSPLLNGPAATEVAGRISPDGRWLAYTSIENGRTEVFVRPYPNVNDDRIPVAAMTARAPAWRNDGRELILRGNDGPWSVPVSYANGRIQLGKPARILEIGGQNAVSLSATPDGSRFLLPASRTSREVLREYRVVLNWFEELKAKFAQR